MFFLDRNDMHNDMQLAVTSAPPPPLTPLLQGLYRAQYIKVGRRRMKET